MNDHLKVAALAVLIVPLTALGAWLSRNHPQRAGRAVVALVTVGFASFGSMDVGYRLSALRGALTDTSGYSCGKAKSLGLLLIFGAVVLVRAAWQSIHADGSRTGRASKLELVCLGLFLTGFTFSESEKAHDRFHQVHPRSEAHR